MQEASRRRSKASAIYGWRYHMRVHSIHYADTIQPGHCSALKEIRNAGERDPCWSRRLGQQHARRHECVEAVFLVERVHRGRKPRPPRFALKARKEAERVPMIGYQVAQPHA